MKLECIESFRADGLCKWLNDARRSSLSQLLSWGASSAGVGKYQRWVFHCPGSTEGKICPRIKELGKLRRYLRALAADAFSYAPVYF